MSNNLETSHPWMQNDRHNEPIMAETEVTTIIEIEASIPIKTGLNAKKYGMINAEQEVDNLVKQNSYLSKGLSGYLTTANWALKEGIKTPNYYN